MPSQVEEPEIPVEVTTHSIGQMSKTVHATQSRYVKDRLPGIEEADLDNEDAVRQLMHECQVTTVRRH